MPPPSRQVRLVILSILLLLLLHLLAQSTSPRYAYHTSLNMVKTRLELKERPAEVWLQGRRVKPWELLRETVKVGRESRNETAEEKTKACFVVLVREEDLFAILPSIQQLEDRFNWKYKYTWVFLNDGSFSEHFKKLTSAVASGEVRFGTIPEAHWPRKGFPGGIDEQLAREKITAMGKLPIPYGGSHMYRNMIRYQSGFFWRHPLLDDFEYYWRVEPNVKFFCDIDYDPFRLLKEQGKQYDKSSLLDPRTSKRPVLIQ